MSWSTLYLFKFNSTHGVEHSIHIQQDGYSGPVKQRALGRGPVLKKQQNGPICGTSLEIIAECVEDGEFSILYTSNPKEYRVCLYRGNTLVWVGFVSTELYSEPSVAPPYDVQIIATDGLGELKLDTYAPAGFVTLSQLLRSMLARTGESRNIHVASSLIMSGQSVVDTMSMSINLDYLDNSSYYDLLTKLLDSLHATITQYRGEWLIVRESDLHTLYGSGSLSVVTIGVNGAVSSGAIGGVTKAVGSMSDATKDTWPIGYLSTAIEPSRREVEVDAPWNIVSGPADPSMEATVDSPWTSDGQVTHDTSGDDCFYQLGLDWSDPDNSPWGIIKQEIDVVKIDCGFELKLRVSPRVYRAHPSDYQLRVHGQLKAYLEYDLYETSSSGSRVQKYYGTEKGWTSPVRAQDTVEIPTVDLESVGERWLSVKVPAIATPDSTNRYLVSDSAKLRIVIEGFWVNVYECLLTPSLDLPGYRDIIRINNGARGKSNPVEIIGGRVREETIVNPMFYGGIWLYNGSPVTSFADSRHEGGDFLAIAALSYASSVATPRMKTEGTINVPAGFSSLPLMLTVSGVLSWIDTCEWMIADDELSISALSLPANIITVESETVSGMDSSGSSGRSSSGNGSGSSASDPYSYNTNGTDYFEEDGEGGIKLKDQYTGLWAAGFISAGGIGASSGGGGADLMSMWLSLMSNEDDFANDKIHYAHLPLGTGFSIDPATGLVNVTATGSVTSVAGVSPIGGDVPKAVLQDELGISSLGEITQSLQAQIDAVASRDNFDDLTASALYADIASVSSLYAGALLLDGKDVASTISTLEGYFTNGSANSALRLTTVSKTAWGQTFWTADGVPTDVSGNMTGVGSLSASGLIKTTNYLQGTRLYLTDSVYLEYDSDSAGVKLVGAGFWTESYVTAGGVGSSSGGGDVDLDRVWESLTNNIDFPNVKINTAHIPDTASIYGYLKGNQTITLTGVVTGSGTTSIATSIADGALSIAKVAGLQSDLNTAAALLQSLQAQIDSVASRDNYDELTATAFYADTAAVSGLYAGAISLGGADLAGSLSSLSSRASSLESRAASLEGRASVLEGYFTNGSANSALRLTTVSKTAWGQTFWTADGVPTDVSGNMTGVGSLSASGLIKTTNYLQGTRLYLTDSVYLEYDSDSAGVKLVGAGFWTESYVTAGGIGSSSGGGGDVDLDRVWESLTNNIDFPNVKINTAHIPDTASIYGYLKGNQTITLTGVVTGSGTTSIATSIADGALSIAKVAGLKSDLNTAAALLQSLQAQIDSVAARDMFDELSATVACFDTVVASSARFDAIVGELSGNATTASYLVSASYGVGGSYNPVYFSGGRPVASTATVGSASVPMWMSGGTLTAITPSSLFSTLSSSAAANLSMTIAGQNRTATLYATYDSASENISDKFGIVSAALQSLQSQVDSVASRNMYDELTATLLFTDMLSVAADALVGGTFKVLGAASITGTLSVSSTANLYGALNVSGLATIAGGIKLTTTKKIWFDDTHYIELLNGYLHTNLPVVSESYVVAGAAGTNA